MRMQGHDDGTTGTRNDTIQKIHPTDQTPGLRRRQPDRGDRRCWMSPVVRCHGARPVGGPQRSVVLRCAVLCSAVLCCAVLCCAVMRSAVLCCAVLCCAVLCSTVLCCAVMCSSVQCSAVQCCVVL